MDDLVLQFVNGKVQNRFKDLAAALEEFFIVNQPIIEDMHTALRVFERRTIANVRTDDIRESLRKDLDDGRKCLASYTRMFSRVDNTLAMISSNFSLPRFLAENNISSSHAWDFQQDLNAYWGITYGEMIDCWNKIRTKLNELKTIIEREVRILERMPTTYYLEGFEASAELRAACVAERNVFYEVMKFYEESNNYLLKSTAARLETQYSKTKAEIRSVIKMAKGNYLNDVKTAQTKIQKGVIITLYLIGAYHVLRSTKSNLIRKGVTSLFQKILSPSYSRLDSRSQQLIAVHGQTQEFLTVQVRSAEELVNRVQLIYDHLG